MMTRVSAPDPAQPANSPLPVARLADLPPARRRRLAEALLRHLHHQAVDVHLSLPVADYDALAAAGVGYLAAERAVLDLLTLGLAEAGPTAGKQVSLRAARGATTAPSENTVETCP